MAQRVNKLYLLYVLIISFCTLAFFGLSTVNADWSPASDNLVWTGEQVYDSYDARSQFITVGINPYTYYFHLDNRNSTDTYAVYLSSVSGAYSYSVSLGYAYTVNRVDLEILFPAATFYADTKMQFRYVDVVGGSYATTNAFLEANAFLGTALTIGRFYCY